MSDDIKAWAAAHKDAGVRAASTDRTDDVGSALTAGARQGSCGLWGCHFNV